MNRLLRVLVVLVGVVAGGLIAHGVQGQALDPPAACEDNFETPVSMPPAPTTAPGVAELPSHPGGEPQEICAVPTPAGEWDLIGAALGGTFAYAATGVISRRKQRVPSTSATGVARTG